MEGQVRYKSTTKLLGPKQKAQFAAETSPTAANATGAARAVEDVASYPVLTEEIGYPPSPLARAPGLPAPTPSAGQIGQTAVKAISDVLGWQLKADPKGFLGALNASFSLEDVEGHTEATWTPRTYAVQTDLSGGITGAQASVYARAKDALDQSLPLLDGLYPLFKEAADEDVAAIRATVRSQFTDLVNEVAWLGGPRISRVTQLFFLLLCQNLPTNFADVPGFNAGNNISGDGDKGPLQTDPDKLGGSLGNLRVEFGFSLSDDLVNTVQDEQNLTNYRIIADYLTSLAQSWLNNLQFFGINTTTPFFGTQLVLLSRQLSVIAETNNEVRFTLDSVFIGPAERQTLQIGFVDQSLPPMFFEDLLTWIDSFASQEGPQLIQDGGKFAVGQSFVPIATKLAQLVQGARHPHNISALPRGYRTVRVQRSLQDLSDQLQQLVDLATPIQHIITPEPEPALSVLGVNPNVVSVSQSFGTQQTPSQATLTIVGTGFDVNTTAANLIISATDPTGRTLTFSTTQRGFLSDNLAYVMLPNPGKAAIGSYQMSITVKNSNQITNGIVTSFTVIS